MVVGRFRRPVTRRSDGRYRIRLDAEARALLARLADELDPILEDPSADPGLTRLFPPAHPDDVMAEAQWQIEMGDALIRSRREALAVVRDHDGADLEENAMVGWVQAINALRLVLAERLGIADEDTVPEISEDDPQLPAWALYDFLSWLVDAAARALEP